MNPNAGGEKPQPHIETPSVSSERYGSDLQKQEKLANTPESQPSGQPTAPVIVVPVSAPVVMPDDQSSANILSPQAAASPGQAKPTDRIEKIWVDRAKAIISQTKDDPFVQKKEMSKFKAEYIKKHFNKDIKIDDAVA